MVSHGAFFVLYLYICLVQSTWYSVVYVYLGVVVCTMASPTRRRQPLTAAARENNNTADATKSPPSLAVAMAVRRSSVKFLSQLLRKQQVDKERAHAAVEPGISSLHHLTGEQKRAIEDATRLREAMLKDTDSRSSSPNASPRSPYDNSLFRLGGREQGSPRQHQRTRPRGPSRPSSPAGSVISQGSGKQSPRHEAWEMFSEEDLMKLHRCLGHFRLSACTAAFHKWQVYIQKQIWGNLELKARNIALRACPPESGETLGSLGRKDLRVFLEWLDGITNKATRTVATGRSNGSSPRDDDEENEAAKKDANNVFAKLSRDDMRALVQGSSYREYNENEPIFFQGSPGKHYYVVLRGEVRICVLPSTSTAVRRSMAYMRKGSWMTNDPHSINPNTGGKQAAQKHVFGTIDVPDETPILGTTVAW